ncbi:MAG: thymidine phosphorylase [Elusimicrobia bacterium]|nr:thymidine phosphorylase [Elusimicrobiota bacterium]
MRLLDLIAKKRDGGAHTPAELEFIASCAAGGRGTAPDYQLSAWLMAVVWRGMSDAETVAWTRAMARSGRRLDLSSIRAPKVDKHSTGGVGDGISLVLAPLVASAGVTVPMMSGRGLGHTGGTLDKLESVRGFKVRLETPQIERQLAAIGVCMFGQSEDLAPADRKLYALRDATATVESQPLIVGSILSKKLAEDLGGLVLDIKCGSGAILRDPREALRLGRKLVATARRLDLRCVGLVTGMDQPLGRVVGNALELRQAIEVLQGDCTPGDYLELTLALGGWMTCLAGAAKSWEAGARLLESRIRDGGAIEKFRQMVKAQGGDPRVVDDPDRVLPRAPEAGTILAPKSGYLTRLDARGVGVAAVALGAGRSRMEDPIDYGAGIRLLKKLGDPVKKGEPVARLYARDRSRASGGATAFRASFAVGARRPPLPSVVREVIR